MFTQKLVYVCSPVRGNVAYNIARAKEYCREVLIAGYIPLAPNIAFEGVLDDNIQQERETALAAGLEMLKRCDELWCFGDIISAGMAAEIEAAKEIGIPVKKVIFGSGNKPVHEVKILPQYFEEVQSGRKTFEYRKDDRGYKAGDIIKLKEYIPETNTFTGNSLEAEITYILKGDLNITTDYAIMSITKL
jgi:hypothetical protein